MKTFFFQIYNPGSLIANIQTHIIFYFAFENFQIDKLAENHCFQKTYRKNNNKKINKKKKEKKKKRHIDIMFREREKQLQTCRSRHGF